MRQAGILLAASPLAKIPSRAKPARELHRKKFRARTHSRQLRRLDQVQTFLSVEIIIATEIMHCFVDFSVKGRSIDKKVDTSGLTYLDTLHSRVC